jgi:sulfur transfer complex TusBCD TusB component (DsrH family)
MKTKYGDERMTRLKKDVEEASLGIRSQSKYVIVSPDSGYKSLDEVPLKKSYYPNRTTSQPKDVFVSKGSDEVTVVHKDGSANKYPIFTQDGKLEFERNDDEEGNQVVGIATDKDKILLMINEDGIALAIDNPQSSNAYLAFNSEYFLSHAVGINPKDKFFVINTNGNSYWNFGKSLTIRRRGSKGKRFNGLVATDELYVVKDGQSIWDPSGGRVDPFKVDPGSVFKFKIGKSKLHVVSEKQNVVLLKDGNFRLMNRKQVVPHLRKGNIIKIWPL